MRGLSAISVAFGLSLIQSAAASPTSIRQTLEGFDFFGTWAVSCERPPAPDNVIRTVYVTTNGQIEFSETFGEDYEPNIYGVLAADTYPHDTIVLRVDLNGEIRQRLTMRRKDGRIRTVTNQNLEDGSFVVRNEAVAKTGQATPWLSHCAEPHGTKNLENQ
jgi:hypothetical protein